MKNIKYYYLYLFVVICIVNTIFSNYALAQYAPENPSSRDGLPPVYDSTVLTLLHSYLISNGELAVGNDYDNDGYSDWVEYLTGSAEDNDNPATKPLTPELFNLALALNNGATGQDDHTATPSLTANLQAQLDSLHGSTFTLSKYLPYLTPTLETQFHIDICKLAKKLEYNPAKIYNWVYNNIRYENYTGSRKGALATYRTRRGNEWDQCSLLITLLRISGIPARYAVKDTYDSDVHNGSSFIENDLVYVQAWMSQAKYLPAKNVSRYELDSPHHGWISIIPWKKNLRKSGGNDQFTVDSSTRVVSLPDALNIFEDDGSRKNYYVPDSSDSVEFTNHTQQTSIEYFKKTLGEYMRSQGNGLSVKEIPQHIEIITRTNDNIPFTVSKDIIYSDNFDPSDLTAESDGSRIYTEVQILKAAESEYDYDRHLRFKKDLIAAYNFEDNDKYSQSTNNYFKGVKYGGTLYASSIIGNPELNENGKIGKYISFDQKDSNNSDESQFVFIPITSVSPEISVKSFTFSGWIRPTISNNDKKVLLDFGHFDGTSGLTAKGKGISIVSINDDLRFSWGDTNNKGIYTQQVDNILPISQWTHIVMLFECDTVNNISTVKIYVNGTEHVTYTKTGTGNEVPTNIPITPTQDANGDYGYFAIGGIHGTAINDATNVKNFIGDLDDIRLYSRKITEDEILSAYNFSNHNFTNNSNYTHNETVGEYDEIVKYKASFPQIATRRLTLDFKEADHPDDSYIKTYEAVFQLDGHDLINTPVQKLDVFDRFHVNYSRVSTPSSSYDHNSSSNDEWSGPRPPMKVGSHAAFAFNPLAASREDIYELYNEISSVSISDLYLDPSATDYSNKREAYLGRMSTILARMFEYRHIRSTYETLELVHAENIYTENSGRSLIAVWTDTKEIFNPDPDTSDSDVDDGHDGAISTLLVNPAWQIDAFADIGSIFKYDTYNGVTGWHVLNQEFNNYILNVIGTTASYNESKVFEDTLGTPALSTITGIFSAINNDQAVITASGPFRIVDDNATTVAVNYIQPDAVFTSSTESAWSSRTSTNSLSPIVHVSYNTAPKTATNQTPATAVYTINPPSRDTYALYIWNPVHSVTSPDAISTNTKITVKCRSGYHYIYLDQSINNSQWLCLGVYEFDPSNSIYHSVEISTYGADGIVLADAIGYLPVKLHNDSVVKYSDMDDYQRYEMNQLLSKFLLFTDTSNDTDPNELNEIHIVDDSNTPQTYAVDTSEYQNITTYNAIVQPIGVVSVNNPQNNNQTIFNATVSIIQDDEGISYLFGGFNGGRGTGITNLDLAFAASNSYTNSVYSSILPSVESDSGSLSYQIDQINQNIQSTNIQNASRPTFGDPVDPMTGEFFLQEPPDLNVKSVGVSLILSRFYRSQIVYDGPFGHNWAWSHADTLNTQKHTLGTTTTYHVVYINAERRPMTCEMNESSYSTVKSYPAGTNYKLVKDGDDYEIRYYDGRIIRFELESGVYKLVSKKDANGNTIKFLYEDTNFTDRITSINDDKHGRFIKLEYYAADGQNGEKAGKVQYAYDFGHNLNSTSTDIDYRKTEYKYDSDGNLESFVDIRGNEFKYGYSSGNSDNELLNHNLTTQELPTGEILKVKYYKNDTVAWHENDRGDKFYFSYSVVNRYAESWNEKGYYKKLYWNENGDIIRYDNEDKAIVIREYDDAHNMVKQIDGNGNITEFNYDSNRNLLWTKQPDGGYVIYKYGNVSGDSNKPIWRATHVITPRAIDNGILTGVLSESDYDTKGNLIESNTNKSLVTITISKIIDGTYIDQNGDFVVGNTTVLAGNIPLTTKYSYDDFGNLLETRIIHPTNSPDEDTVVAHAYDIHGINRVHSIDAAGSKSQFFYDDLDRLVTTVDPLGNKKEVEYDKYGNVIRSSNLVGIETVNVFDSLNRLIKKTTRKDAVGNDIVTEFTYETPLFVNVRDRLKTVIDPLGHITKHEYDEVGNRIKTIDPLGNIVKYKYDELERLSETINPLNQSSRIEYDAVGNKSALYGPSVSALAFSWNSTNVEVDTHQDDNARALTQITYDEMNRPVFLVNTIDGGSGNGKYRAVESEYDLAGNLILEKTGYVDDQNDTTLDANNILLITRHYYDQRNQRVRTVVSSSGIDPGSDDDDDVYETGERATTITYDHLGRVTETMSWGPVLLDASAWTTNTVLGVEGIQKTVNEYDISGNLIKQMVYAWDATNDVWLDGNGQELSTTEHTYDIRNLRIKTIDPNGQEYHFRYDEAGRKIAEYSTVTEHAFYKGIFTVGPYHKGMYYTYDSLGNVVLVESFVGGEWSDEFGKFVDHSNGSLLVRVSHTSATYNKRNEKIATTDALGNVTSFQYDANGNMVATFDPDGNVTRMRYDALNRVVAKENALGQVSTIEYDPNGKKSAVTNALGHRTTFHYDISGKLSQTINAENEYVKYVYDEYGRLVYSFDPRSFNDDGTDSNVKLIYSTQEYNALGEVTATKSFDSSISTTEPLSQSEHEYDGAGRVVVDTLYLKDNGDSTFNKQYTLRDINTLGRVTRLIQAATTIDQAVTDYVYDDNGNLLSESNLDVTWVSNAPVIGSAITKTEHIYDEMNRRYQTTIVDPSDPTNTNGNHLITTVWYSGSTRTTTSYDHYGKSSSVKNDILGRSIELTDKAGKKTTRTYDNRGNLIKESYPTDTNDANNTLADVVTEYDVLNRPIKVTQGNIVTETEYDDLGRVVKTVDPNSVITRTHYDKVGRRITLIEDQGGDDEATTKYEYDKASNLIKLTDAKGAEFQYEYDALSRRTKEYDADETQFLISGNTESNLQIQTFTYDMASNPIEILHYIIKDNNSQKNLSHTYRTYDNLNRLVTVGEDFPELTYDDTYAQPSDDLSNHIQQRFTYDAISRMIKATDYNKILFHNGSENVAEPLGIHTIEFTYDFASRLTKEEVYDDIPTNKPAAVSVRTIQYTHNTSPSTQKLAVSYPTGPDNTSRTFDRNYDARGMLSSVEETTSNYNHHHASYAYDVFGRTNNIQLGHETSPPASLEFTYDQYGRESQRSYIDNNSTQPTLYKLDTTYDDNSNVLIHDVDTSSSVPNQPYEIDYLYDRLNRVKSEARTQTGGMSVDRTLTWTYDNVGNRTNFTNSSDTNQNTTYTDITGDNQYTNKDSNDPTNVLRNEFEYERGNITRIGRKVNTSGWRPDANTKTFTYDWANRIQTHSIGIDAGTFHYLKEASFYTYDALNRRVSRRFIISDAGTGSAVYKVEVYAYDGKAVAQTFRFDTDSAGGAINTTTKFKNLFIAENGSNVVQYYSYDNTSLYRSYIYGSFVDERIAMYDETDSDTQTSGIQPTLYYYIHDRNYSTIGLVELDSSGSSAASVVESYQYTSFGKLTAYSVSGSTFTEITSADLVSDMINTYTYTGRSYDADTNLYHYRNRMYSPTLGRFLQRDPAGFVDGYNMYAYVKNNPVVRIDPYGTDYTQVVGNNVYWVTQKDGWLSNSVSERIHIGTVSSGRRTRRKDARRIQLSEAMGGGTVKYKDVSTHASNLWAGTSDNHAYLAKERQQGHVKIFVNQVAGGNVNRTSKTDLIVGNGLSGLGTGLKATANSLTDTAVGLVTLGFADPIQMFEVTAQDVKNGYNMSYGLQRAGFEILSGMGVGALASKTGKVGKIGEIAFAVDVGGNVSAIGQGGLDASVNGLNWQNGSQMLFGVAGSVGNFSSLSKVPKFEDDLLPSQINGKVLWDNNPSFRTEPDSAIYGTYHRSDISNGNNGVHVRYDEPGSNGLQPRSLNDMNVTWSHEYVHKMLDVQEHHLGFNMRSKLYDLTMDNTFVKGTEEFLADFRSHGNPFKAYKNSIASGNYGFSQKAYLAQGGIYTGSVATSFYTGSQLGDSIGFDNFGSPKSRGKR